MVFFADPALRAFNRGGSLPLRPRELARSIKLDAQLRKDIDRIGFNRAVDRMNLRCLRAAGAATRGTMQHSMRKAKDKGRLSDRSKPGNPPKAHERTGAKLKRLITFQVESPGGHPTSVVIGPTLTKSKSRVPRVMEFGGRVSISGKKVLKPNGQVYKRNPKLRLRSTPADKVKADRQMKHIKDYYSRLRTVDVKVDGVKIAARPFAKPTYRRMVAKGYGRFWMRQLRAVR